jgi:hypothetical protein
MLCCGMENEQIVLQKIITLGVLNYARLGIVVALIFIKVANLSYRHDPCIPSHISVWSEMHPLYEA